MKTYLQQLSDEARIPAAIETLTSKEKDALLQLSKDSQLIFIPFSIKGTDIFHPLDKHDNHDLQSLPIIIFGLSAQDIDLDAEPEEGPQTSIARVIDRIEHVVQLQKEQQKKNRCLF